MTALGCVSRALYELSAARNCTRDEGGPFEFGDQEPISSHRKLLRAKAVVVSVAETPGQDFGRHGCNGAGAKGLRCSALATGQLETGGARGRGKAVQATAEHREPCDSRGSCTVLGAPGGEIPPGDSTRAALRTGYQAYGCATRDR